MSFVDLAHSGTAPVTSLTGSINASATSFTVADGTGFPTAAHYVVIDPTTDVDSPNSSIEKLLVTRSGNTFTTVGGTGGRGRDGSSAASHASGAKVMHVFTAVEAAEANDAARLTLGLIQAAGDLLVGSAANTLARLAKGSNGQVLGMTAGAVAWGALPADSVGSSQIAADAVGSSEIAANAVGTSELADNAVDTGAIAADAVTGAKIADDTIDSEHYVDGSIDTAHIADSQITQAKMADDAVGLPELVASAKPRWSVAFGQVTNESVTAGQMEQNVGIFTAATALVFIPYVAPEAGAIVGLSVALGAARTAGTITFTVYKNGSTTGFSVVINGTNTQYHYGTQAETEDTFVAGDRIDVRYTTSADFAPNGTDYPAVAHVLLQAV
jgi:hypothetical protein